VLSLSLAGCSGTSSDPAPQEIAAVEYDLGDATIEQTGFPADSPFRTMPVRLNGIIAVPAEGDGPFPVVMVLHGTHPGCPTDAGGVDRWPCDPEDEQRNYAGFDYLVTALAEQGYVALAPNLNAENTFGFGEPTPGERLRALTDLHLGALAEAADGGAADFGVALDGRADPAELAFIGHSRGGEGAVALATSPEVASGEAGYGPAAGVLLAAGATTFRDPWTSISVPVATVLAGCDGDVTDQTGQFFYEGPRLAADQEAWATSVFLEGATHNAFNTILPQDMVDQSDRADCQPTLEAGEQRDWLVDYATSFLDVLFGDDDQARQRLGIALDEPAPSEVLGLPARVAYLPPADDRDVLLIPDSAEGLRTNEVGGAVTADELEATFCPKGFYTADMEPDAQACERTSVTVPGQPALAALSWESSGAALRLAVPSGSGDFSGASTLMLRAAVNPASSLNAPGEAQQLSVRITDASGAAATVSAQDAPALAYPAGELQQDGGTSFFTGIVPLTDIRFPVAEFDGVDLGAVTEVAVLFGADSGALFLADVEFAAE
jgi:dienelactone hydrolase